MTRTSPSRIYLIGFMASGKTTDGYALADCLQYAFIDLDATIEQGEGRSIPSLFQEEGEDYFRKLENSYLKRSVQWDHTIIACGGGTPCFSDNMDWMNNNGLTVFIDLDPGILVDRLRIDRDNRPLLQDIKEEDIERYVQDTLEWRMPFYEKAQIRISIGNEDNPADKLVRSVVAELTD